MKAACKYLTAGAEYASVHGIHQQMAKFVRFTEGKGAPEEDMCSTENGSGMLGNVSKIIFVFRSCQHQLCWHRRPWRHWWHWRRWWHWWQSNATQLPPILSNNILRNTNKQKYKEKNSQYHVCASIPSEGNGGCIGGIGDIGGAGWRPWWRWWGWWPRWQYNVT